MVSIRSRAIGKREAGLREKENKELANKVRAIWYELNRAPPANTPD